MAIKKTTKETPDIKKERLEELKRIIPEAFTEGKIDAEKFFAALGDDIDSRPDRYSFSWAGKKDAIRILQTTSRGTLKPAENESVKWDTTENLFIEGDNLEVLKLLYKSYFGRVKMVYIDPPYNTGNDFIYPDNYADPLNTYLKVTGQKDENGNLMTSNPETNGRYHSSWLSMMYPRLFLARQLLREDGVIFISIDDKEVSNLRLVMNEVFGEENFFAQIVVQSNKRGQTYKQISKTHEYLLIYTRNPDTEINELEKNGDKNDLTFQDDIGPFSVRELRNRNPKFGRFNRPNLFYPIYVNPKISDDERFHPVSLEKSNNFSVEILPFNSTGGESCWRWGKELSSQNIDKNTKLSNLVAKEKMDGGYGIYEKYRKATYKAKSIWVETEVINEKGTVELGEIGLGKYFDFPKPLFLLKKILQIGSSDEDIILDYFSGSCTTAQAVLELNRDDGGNRNFIMVQLPQPTEHEQFPTIADIGKERIRRAIKKIHEEENGQLDLKDRDKPEDLGFKVFKLSMSNYELWEDVNSETDPDIYKDLLKGHEDPLVKGWKSEDVLYEIALKEGYSLNTDIKKEKVGNLTIYHLYDPEREQFFRVCLDKKLTLEELKPLNLKKDDLFVCRNIALDDTIAANLALQCRLMVI